MPNGRLLLLDSASLYFRAFFGVPDSLKAPDGTVVNALRGMLDFIATLSTEFKPTAIVACWDDDWRPQWRVDLMDTYKTHRVGEDGGEGDTTDGLLGPQVPLIAEALALLGIPRIGAAGAEADDIIGTLSGQWDGPVDVVTGDRDLFQLVDDSRSVRVIYTSRGGVGNPDLVDNAWMRERYSIDSSQYVDFAVMRGDPSDGIPGVPGIGDKTGAVLLNEFGDLDGIIAAAEDPSSSIKPRVRQSLKDSADYIAAARTVVAVKRDACEASAWTLETLTADQQATFRAFAERWGIGGAAERVLEGLAVSS
ncbi:5'-3' exonuclease [Aeromicrobium panaciterrae]|uniref:5'-3' exonuclease n=1 Tax=Aeromicrobium panaciterrae TaxID=363861 RepID=A0ABU1UP34_9ACTN|nr:5'-3' exonuclease [Aeromicrobium panaciterrae]MDR7086920.1 5'-3' exonuclease [Aeromicrobium panaciterrae]